MDGSDLAVAIGYTIAQIAAYLVGALPFGLLIARKVAGIDIREHGSRNIGATNVGRILGFKWFVVVFALDFLKGAMPVAAALWVQSLADPADVRYWFLPETMGFAAILGHVFPIYLRFKGGKGVATSLGVISFLAPMPATVALATWLTAMAAWRVVSLASLIAAAAFATCHFLTCSDPWSLRNFALTAFVLSAAALIVVRHRENIKRLLAGTEPRVQFRRRNHAG